MSSSLKETADDRGTTPPAHVTRALARLQELCGRRVPCDTPGCAQRATILSGRTLTAVCERCARRRNAERTVDTRFTPGTDLHHRALRLAKAMTR